MVVWRDGKLGPDHGAPARADRVAGDRRSPRQFRATVWDYSHAADDAGPHQPPYLRERKSDS
jgi:hypothetical protein